MTSKPLPEGDLLQVLREAGGAWERFRGQRLFITGATGFFGRWLLESLLSADSTYGLELRIVALSRDPSPFLAAHPHLAVGPKLTWTRGSVSTLGPASLEGRRFDQVIHLATEADLEATRSDPAAAIQVIADGTRNALEVAVEAGARRFLFTSTGSVYGNLPPGSASFDEGMELPRTPSPACDALAIGAEAKRRAELHCAEAAHRGKLEVVIARCFSFAGPGMPMEGKFAFGNFMRDALAGRTIVLTGDGSPVRSYLYGSDLTVWLLGLLSQGSPGSAYNVGSEQAVTLRELAETIAHELGAPGVEVRAQPVPGGSINRYIPSTEKARSELGLRETTGLVQAIRKTADWLRH